MPGRLKYGGDAFPPGDREIWEEWYESRGGRAVAGDLESSDGASPFLRTRIGYEAQQQELRAEEERAMSASIPPKERLRQAREAVGECYAPPEQDDKPAGLPRVQIGDKNGMIL